MNKADLSRREFLQRTAALGAAVSAGSLLTACGGTPATNTGTNAGQAAALNCTDVSGLTDAEKTKRTSLEYVELSTTAGQTCANCAHFVPAATANTCGTCNVVAGPINPAGHCRAWKLKTG